MFAALGYDNANRRASLSYSNGTTTNYAYDLAGNRTSLAHANSTASLLPNAVTSASYDAANEQTAFAGATLTYDANGNLTNDGTNTYSWDARNRLIGVTGGVNGTFVYEAKGRRIRKTFSGLSTEFLYDGGNIIAEVGSGAVNANYLRSLALDEPFVRQTSVNEFYALDPLHTTLLVTDATASVKATYTHDPYGNQVSTGSSSNPFHYTGREKDDTGFYFYRSRFYSAIRARFISHDPAGLRGGINPYAYVSNNPINYRDPLGLAPDLNSTVTVQCGDAALALKLAVILADDDIKKSPCCGRDKNALLNALNSVRVTCQQPGTSSPCNPSKGPGPKGDVCACADQRGQIYNLHG